MSKFNLNQLLGAKQAESKDNSSGQSYKISFIPITEIEPSKDNFYSVEQIEELKTSIAAFGIKQNLIVTPSTNGKYRVIAGHRRRLAALSLLDEGNKEFEKIPCMIETEEDELRERLLLITTNSTARHLSDWEKIQQAKEMKSILEQIKKRDKVPGRLRDLIASALDTSPTQIGRMETIDKNLTPEFQEELRGGKVNISTAYELSKLPKEQQQEAYDEYQAKGSMSIKDVKEAKQAAPVVNEETTEETKSQPSEPKPEQVQEEKMGNEAGNAERSDQTVKMIQREVTTKKIEPQFGSYADHQPNYDNFWELGKGEDYTFQSLAHMGEASHSMSWALTVLDQVDMPTNIKDSFVNQIRDVLESIQSVKGQIREWRDRSESQS